MRLSIKQALVGCLCLLASTVWSVPNFSFIHMSDSHAPSYVSKGVIQTVLGMTAIELTPYKITANRPAFIIHSGDMCEFSENGYESYQEFFKNIRMPVYDVLGNHDDTWSSLRDKFWAKYGSPWYSFDTYECHFIMLQSPQVQEALPGFEQDQIEWLKADLARTSRTTPIFVTLHHPLQTTEFVSPYERQRLLECFQGYNVVCFFVGHGHTATYHNFDGFDGVQGGSTVKGGPGVGYNIVTIADDSIYVAYRLSDDPTATKPLLQKPLFKKTTLQPRIGIQGVSETQPIRSEKSKVTSTLHMFPGSLTQSYVDVDGIEKVDLKNAGASFTADLPLDKLDNGLHYLRVVYGDSRQTIYKTQTFIYERPLGPIAKWRTRISAASKSSPVMDTDNIYLGSGDGTFYALSKRTGSVVWKYKADAEIIGTPLLQDGKVIFGCGDSNLYCLDQKEGFKVWSFKGDSAFYSSPSYYSGLVFIASKKGVVYGVNLSDGKQKWKNTNPTYTAEGKLTVLNGKVIVAAWDSYVYAINAKDGKTAWRTQAAGSSIRPAAKAYYSAGDCTPVVTESGRLFVADRDWYLSELDPADGALSRYTTNCLAVAASEKGDSLLIRTYRSGDGNLEKWTLNGTCLWTSPIKLNASDALRSVRFPIPAVEKNGKVYAVSCWGTLYCVNGTDGTVLWQYQITPQLPVITVPAVDDNGVVYVTAMNGTVTAVMPPPRASLP